MKRILINMMLLMILSQVSFAQNNNGGTITGYITSQIGNEPLIGASVSIEGTTRGVITDINGYYSFERMPGDEVMVVSYVGFESQKISIGNQTKVNVILVESSLTIPEVVVVGYGTQRKNDLTGAISVIDIEELSKRAVGTVDQALQGQVAGVDVTSNSGTPGGGTMVRIRGIGTLNDASPLFVVDGMMVDDIDFLNSNDIQSMQVLKDASSTAIYGSRGANGVVIISTKKGKQGGKVTLNSYVGIQNFWRTTNVLDANTWGVLKNEAMVAAGNQKPITDPSTLQNTNWYDAITNVNAPISNTDISFSGGNKEGNYFISGSYLNQEGIIKKSGFDRLSLRANSSYKVKPWLKVGENLTLVKTSKEREPWTDEWTSTIITSIAADPASAVYNPDGTFARGTYNDTWNPAAIIEYQNFDDVVYRTIGNVFADISILKDLTFRSNYSLEYSFGETDNYNPVYYVSPVQQNAISRLNKDNSNRLISQWSNTLDYTKKFGEHKLNTLVGIEQYSFDYKYNGLSVNNVPSDDIDIRYISNASGANAATVWGSREQTRQLSYLGRVNYSFMDKYLLTANFRADASSKFSKKNRWGYFPSFSFGWRINQEEFMKDMANVSNLKLRLGWGKIGNQGSVPPYQDVTTASTGSNYVFGGVLAPGSSFPGSGNDEIKWEKSVTTNIGLDYGLFDEKLTGSLEYFIKNTEDMLLQVPVPGLTGVQEPPTQNAGGMKNTGFELSTQYNNRDHELKYSFGVIFSKIKNEVTNLGAEDAFIDGASFLNSYNVTRTAVGRPIAQFYGYKTDGLFQNQSEIDAQTAQQNVAPGDVRYVDEDGDGELDFFYLGSPLPDFTYAFNTNLEFMGFDFTMGFQGVQGNKIFNGTSHYKRSSTANWNLGSDMVNRWTGEGSQNDARYPRMNANDVNNSQMSDRFIEDGSYLRLKTLQLGYTLGNGLSEKLRMEKLRLYVNAQNLLTFTNYSGLDPEIGMRGYDALDIGVDRGFYPQARMFSVGINATF